MSLRDGRDPRDAPLSVLRRLAPLPRSTVWLEDTAAARGDRVLAEADV